LNEVVKPHLEVAKRPETHHCDLGRCLRGLLGMLKSGKVEGCDCKC
jgi:hypothetical protein